MWRPKNSAFKNEFDAFRIQVGENSTICVQYPDALTEVVLRAEVANPCPVCNGKIPNNLSRQYRVIPTPNSEVKGGPKST